MRSGKRDIVLKYLMDFHFPGITKEYIDKIESFAQDFVRSSLSENNYNEFLIKVVNMVSTFIDKFKMDYKEAIDEYGVEGLFYRSAGMFALDTSDYSKKYDEWLKYYYKGEYLNE
jgi:hypothetical protein